MNIKWGCYVFQVELQLPWVQKWKKSSSKWVIHLCSNLLGLWDREEKQGITSGLDISESGWSKANFTGNVSENAKHTGYSGSQDSTNSECRNQAPPTPTPILQGWSPPHLSPAIPLLPSGLGGQGLTYDFGKHLPRGQAWHNFNLPFCLSTCPVINAIYSMRRNSETN